MVGCSQAWRYVWRLGWASGKVDLVQIRRNKRWNIGVIYSEALEINGLRLFGGGDSGFERGGPPT